MKEMKVVTLTGDEVKKIISDYLKTKGYNELPARIEFKFANEVEYVYGPNKLECASALFWQEEFQSFCIPKLYL